MYFVAVFEKQMNMKKTVILFTTLLACVFLTSKTFAQEDLVRVFRWWIPQENSYITVADGEFQDGQLINWGWTGKTLLFFAYKSPGPGRVAIYGWENPVSRTYISVCDDEFTDDQMLKWGYKNKHLQYYALTRRGPNTVCIYRWHSAKRGAWLTVPEENSDETDGLIKKGYNHKTYQYYGIYRVVDAAIYDQL